MFNSLIVSQERNVTIIGELLRLGSDMDVWHRPNMQDPWWSFEASGRGVMQG